MNVKLLVFDLDGTLLDTLDDLWQSVNFALEQCGCPRRKREEIRSFVGNGVVRLMERAAPETLRGEDWAHCFQLFRSHYLTHMTDHTRPYEGILSLLDTLHEKDVKTAVVSNKLHEAVVGLCKDFFGDHIDCAFGVTTPDERKPSPVNVQKALQTLKIAPKNALYVGDSEVDVQTANNAGLSCIGVTWGFRDRTELERAGANEIVDRPDEILKLI